MTLRELYETPSKPTPFIVEGLLPTGLLLIAANPKAGKSRLMLQIAGAVTMGDLALGRFATKKGAVLYYTLEDGPARLERTARELGLTPSDDFVVLSSLDRVDVKGCAQIRDDVSQTPDVQLVVIDVLNRVMPRGDSGLGAYHDEAAALIPLQELSKEKNLAIVVVHHTNKSPEGSDPFRAINGTQALPGTADNVWLLNRDRSKEEATLQVTGRDVKDQRVRLVFDSESGRWRAEDEVPDGPLAPVVISAKGLVSRALRDVVGEQPVQRQQIFGLLKAKLGSTIAHAYLEKTMDECLKEHVVLGTFAKERMGRPTYFWLKTAA